MKSRNLKIHQNKIFLLLAMIGLLWSFLPAQQISIKRIEKMPNLPEPYQMRHWKQVTMGYDSLVFDFNRTGQYLPLVWSDANSVNYPGHSRFGLHTAVGTPHPTAAEAINILPAVIGASLVGVDKSNQNDMNWVLMCEEFFNRRAEENVYLNGPISRSGHDWWYDTMPNVFFYQLYDLYPGTGDFDYQFTMVADRWLEAVTNMGGTTTPWQQPAMNYRAWNLSTMTPLEEGVKQPEAAGAIGWLLYNAFVKTGNPAYRIGAEWCLEFLNNWPINPSYELQLPYGVYAAARMNAELGTTYNIEKLLDWCFTWNGNVRNWGAIIGNWGGYDCDGLIGEAKYAGYAFAMNGFEHAGALVPMVRYDDRFARAIGKWMLNLANASRLFYSKYLPDDHQDNEQWARQNDPFSYIAYEAIREYGLGSGISPYATGDFMRNNWGLTNLVLYGSSHVGIFGGIIDTTNVERILQLDVLITDYFGDPAYPGYLYFNPYSEEKIVEIDVGTDQHDLYDAVSNSFLLTGVSGETAFSIPSDAAVLLVVTPAGGAITYDLDKMLINDIIVDYHSGQPVENYPPRIKSLAAVPAPVMIGEKTRLYCIATDPDNDLLTMDWKADNGAFEQNQTEVYWTAPDIAGEYRINCSVSDGRGGADSANVQVQVINNHLPIIHKISVKPSTIEAGESTELVCVASDPDNDSLFYEWRSVSGTLTAGGSTACWKAPETNGIYYVSCLIKDSRGGQAVDSVGVVVGKLIASYPFNGNAFDESNFGNHGTVYGAVPVADHLGNANSAYYFDGIDDYILVREQFSLNFQDAITVSFWLKADEYSDGEVYPVSHGNWENRWKISISPGTHTIRWTIKTTTGIKDLDSQTKLDTGIFYYVTTVYNGADFEIYINGKQDAATNWSGLIAQTQIDLTIGQVLPNNSRYNFKGVLDDIRIYNQALSRDEIKILYDESLSITEHTPSNVPNDYFLYQNFPNPFNNQTTIRYQIKEAGQVAIEIYDIQGQLIRTLVDRENAAGAYTVIWDGKDRRGYDAASGIYFYKMTTGAFCRNHKLVLIK